MAKSFRDLVVWQKGIQLTVIVYQLSKAFPREEIYGLTSQMRRAAVSIPSNIAEGCGRLNTAEYRQFLGIAKGSNFELQTQLVIAGELGYGDSVLIAKAESLPFEVGKMIYATIATLENPRNDSGQAVPPVLQSLTTNH
jgi:four helix bundle protein